MQAPRLRRLPFPRHLAYIGRMAETLYSIDILRLAASTAQWPPLDGPEGSAERRSVTCGSRVRVDVALDEAGRIAALGFAINACALGQASAAILAAHAMGRDEAAIRTAGEALRAWLSGASGTPPDWPGIAALVAARAYPARHASILLPFETVADAIAAARTPERSRAHG